MWVRDRLDGLWDDEDFAGWYPRNRRPGISPWPAGQARSRAPPGRRRAPRPPTDFGSHRALVAVIKSCQEILDRQARDRVTSDPRSSPRPACATLVAVISI